MLARKSSHQRRSILVPDFDYSGSGAYFVTVVSHKRKNIFGDVKNDQVLLSPIGRIVQVCWQEIPTHFPRVNVDNFVIMPNQIHGNIVIDDGDDTNVRERPSSIPRHFVPRLYS